MLGVPRDTHPRGCQCDGAGVNRLDWLKIVFLRYYRSMGLRVFLYAVLSVVATLASPFVNRLLGDGVSAGIDFGSVTPVLTILASSMLAVSTFSLSIMVSAHRAAANTATPRVHRILLEDTTTQSVLSVFIGAFVYSLGSLVLYRLGFYPDEAALVVMAITTLVVVAVILSLLRWINHLTTLGSIEESLQTAQVRSEASLLALARQPGLGASKMTDDTIMPPVTTPLRAGKSGYLQLIDMAMLDNCLPDQSTLYLEASPGQHVLTGEVIGQVSGTVDETLCAALLKAFTFGDFRTHEQDAEFGLVIISEIGLKALSPGINDPGTAIEAITRLKTLLWQYVSEPVQTDAPVVKSVVARFPGPSDLVEASFGQISRDSAGSFLVSRHLLESLTALSAAENEGLANAARAMATQTIARAEEAGVPQDDMDRLRSAAP
ncbi:DUF2254 domain-containing protein [Tateyamaria sp. SN6-1]|uniref:DUF2254 domain-containing protein n=1 Tax=Tateyamaria sp. SN6-1 TaxID=3092148 RepID=UPI0039F56860